MASPVAANSIINNTESDSNNASNGNGNINGGNKGKKDRPCDACRKRKSRCVVKEGARICVLCEFHRQECTFLQTPLPRKRKLGNGGEGVDERERGGRRWKSSSRSPEPEPSRHPSANIISSSRRKSSIRDYADLKGPSLLKKTLGLQSHRHSRYIGRTTDLEPSVLLLSTFDKRDEGQFAGPRNTLRKVSSRDLFLMLPDSSTQNHASEVHDLDAIESLVAPHGPALITLYFRIVHPSFPILHKRVYLEKYNRTHREFSPPLLAAVYILALNWWSYSSALADLPKPDVKMLESLALKTMADVIHRPKLSTVQAGLLLLQRPGGDSWSLTAQLMVVGQDLGLHLDCTNWKIPRWELGLRRRLAWGLYMQDKWCSLIYGRPSILHSNNWMVAPVSVEDFPENATDEDEEEGSTEVEKGMILFTEMISLTRILSEILENFYSLVAMDEVEKAGREGPGLILERAKPVQIKLRDWFSRLPDCLRLDSTKLMKLSSTGYLHLAYYTTEITLHRVIISTLSSYSSQPSHHSPAHQIIPVAICREAARTRLLSAISFIQSLRAEHLQSFWYFASPSSLSIIGTFGALLWATSDDRDEAEYYKSRLGEYKWVLRVSSKGVDFMESALGGCENWMSLLGGALEKKQTNRMESDVETGPARRLQKASSDHTGRANSNSNSGTNNVYTLLEKQPRLQSRSSASYPANHDQEPEDQDYDFDHAIGGAAIASQMGLAQEMQVSPSDTTSADTRSIAVTEGDGYEAGMEFYHGVGEVGHPGLTQDYGFMMDGPVEWMGHGVHEDREM